MVESASLTPSGPSRLAERKAATATLLSSVARRMTAERGLNGFTIEELCDEVGVSRRTFFNYFPSKEEAVVGVADHENLARFAGDFLARGSRGWPAVVDDLIELVVEHARDAGLAEHADFIVAVGREPKLLARFIDISRERETQLAELIATREGVAPGDPLARAAVQVVGTALRTAGERIIVDREGDDFASALTDSLAALRAVLSAPTSRTKDTK